ncbi:DNA topoisomerase [Salinimonas lutimaris]|uniref:DNA topoisomerase n=1 Tax=Salinimonas lutimaris TaxID=914153 RepID=UPI0010BFA366|nr:DNA topoisomerase [Salinimonas lutimaris]
MTQSNSAHEPIKILVDDEELAVVYKALSDKAQNSKNESYSVMLQTLDVLSAFAKADSAGEALLHEAHIILESNKSDCHIVFETHELEEAGWTEYLQIDNPGDMENTLNKADLAKLKQGEFDIEVELPDVLHNLTIDELLSKMDDFKIGRPSTYADILDDVTNKHELLDITDGNVRLTQLGLRAAEYFTSFNLEEFSALFCHEFSTDLEGISEGIMSPTDMLLKYLPLVASREEIEAFKNNAWRTLSDIDIDVK